MTSSFEETCSRVGCTCAAREELVYIVGEQYYCKRCFGEFASQCAIGKLTRWEWITGFRHWAATTPLLNEYLQQAVGFTEFEQQARTLVRSAEVEQLYRRIEETEKHGEEAYTADSSLSTAVRLTRLLTYWQQDKLLEKLQLAVTNGISIIRHEEKLRAEAGRRQ